MLLFFIIKPQIETKNKYLIYSYIYDIIVENIERMNKNREIVMKGLLLSIPFAIAMLTAYGEDLRYILVPKSLGVRTALLICYSIFWIGCMKLKSNWFTQPNLDKRSLQYDFRSFVLWVFFYVLNIINMWGAFLTVFSFDAYFNQDSGDVPVLMIIYMFGAIGYGIVLSRNYLFGPIK